MDKPKGHRDLIVYQKAFSLAMKIFDLTKRFPKEETYSLVDQIRRSSRSVCSCLAEAYRKRRYQPYFVNKLTDADGENSETIVWLEFSLSSGYISAEQFNDMEQAAEEVGRILSSMIANPEKFLPKGEKIKKE
jgi:four helix bundle protein